MVARMTIKRDVMSDASGLHIRKRSKPMKPKTQISPAHCSECCAYQEPTKIKAGFCRSFGDHCPNPEFNGVNAARKLKEEAERKKKLF